MENKAKLSDVDPEIYRAIGDETGRQENGLELIASENFVSPAVLEAMGSTLTNKYAEGYPGKRYYGGCEFVDVAENLAIARAKSIFGADHVNVQPHSGSQANMAAYMALMQVGDTMLALDLNSGGHLTHGAPFNFSGKLYKVVHYGLSRQTETIDFDQVQALAKEHRGRCLVIDPVSTWSKSGSESSAHSVAERLIDWAKAEGITLLCTSLLDEMASQEQGGSSLQISTLADTWIHLNYLVQAGERNRGLAIIKSRGTAHSNQVRELILSDAGVTLTDTYAAGGEVLMGTLRWEKERAESVANEVTEVAGKLKRVRLDAEEAELEVRVKSLQVELEAKQVEKALLARTTKTREGELSRGRTRMGELRGADAAIPGRKAISP